MRYNSISGWFRLRRILSTMQNSKRGILYTKQNSLTGILSSLRRFRGEGGCRVCPPVYKNVQRGSCLGGFWPSVRGRFRWRSQTLLLLLSLLNFTDMLSWFNVIQNRPKICSACPDPPHSFRSMSQTFKSFKDIYRNSLKWI